VCTHVCVWGGGGVGSHQMQQNVERPSCGKLRDDGCVGWGVCRDIVFYDRLHVSWSCVSFWH